MSCACTLTLTLTRYYNPAVHAAAFVLPVFAEKVVAPVRRPSLPHVASSVTVPIFR